MNQIVLITGATSGFGKSMAYKYAENNYSLIITGRRTERLNELKAEIETKYGVEVLALSFDVRNKEEVDKAIDSLPKEWKYIDILINNAGLALGTGGIQDGNVEDWETMINTNVKGLLYVSKAVMPLMIERETGHIVNIGSTAGKETYPGGNVYCATKHAVHALSDGMRMDLVKYGIKVTEVCPGMAETEFSLVRYKGDKQAADNVYKGVTPLVGEDIADIVYFITSGLGKHVEIREIEISCQQQASAFVVNRK